MSSQVREDKGPLVSVIMPSFNREHLIVDTLESVFLQTYRPIELIVVDDGSTDETVARIQAWDSARVKSAPDFSLQLVQQPNRGAPAARNRGFSVSSGPYIQFLDSDDVLSEDKLERQVAALKTAEDLAVAFCETLFFKSDQAPEKGVIQQGRRMVGSTDPTMWLTDLLGWDGRGGMIAPHAWLIPRKIALRAGPWRECLTTNQDGEYFARVVLESPKTLKTKGWAYYRVHQTGTTQSARTTQADFRSLLNSFLFIEERLMENAEKEQMPRVKAAIARHFMEIAYQSYPRYRAILALAERWAHERKPTIGPPTPQASSRSALLHQILGWRVTRILSKVYHG